MFVFCFGSMEIYNLLDIIIIIAYTKNPLTAPKNVFIANRATRIKETAPYAREKIRVGVLLILHNVLLHASYEHHSRLSPL